MRYRLGGLVAVLICISFIAPALGEGVEMFEGADGVSNNGYGKATTVSSYKTLSGGTVAEMQKGLDVSVTIPKGKQGNAWARLNGAGTLTKDALVNGDYYKMITNYAGQDGEGAAYVNAGARKTVKEGVMSAAAKVIAVGQVDNGFMGYPCPTCKKNILSGWAEVSSTTSSTSTGETYAYADGSATFNVYKRCPTCPVPVKEVWGRASGVTDIESINDECPLCPTCKPPKPTGTLAGTAKIYAAATADDWTSYSTSKLSTDLTSKRGKNSGISEINAYADGYANSYAIDGTSPEGADVNGDYNVETEAAASRMYSYANTYAIKDQAIASTNLIAQAWHNTADGNLDYEKAYNQLTSDAKVLRADANSLYGPAEAYNEIWPDTGSFFARAQDNTDTDKFAEESAIISDMWTSVLLENVYDTKPYAASSINLELTAVQDNGQSTADIRNRVSVQGPSTGDSADISSARELFEDLHAQAQSTSSITDVASVDITDEPKDVWYDKYGDGSEFVFSNTGTLEPYIQGTETANSNSQKNSIPKNKITLDYHVAAEAP